MAHWLEELERQESRKHQSAKDSARIQDKIFRIRQNYEKNQEIYDGFLEKLVNLVNRVNHLPLQHRKEFGMIGAKAKESKLDNKLHYFSSSRRVTKIEYRGILNPLKNVHYKHIRVVFFNVAKIMDKAEIELKEEMIEKKRHDGKVIPEHPEGSEDSSQRGRSRENYFHNVYYYDMDKLTEDFALRLIDWLTFHEDIEYLPVIHDGEARF